MCIVCGSGAQHLLRAIVGRHAPQPRATRLTASAVAPEVQPPLDPGATDGLIGPADVILRGGPIIPMSGAPDAEAIAVRAGRIQAVGDAETVMAHRGRLTRVIDLQGRAVLPGFVNAHWHMPFTLLCDWVDATGLPDAAVRQALAAAAAGEFVVATVNAVPAGDWGADNPLLFVDRDGNILGSNSRVSDCTLPAHVSGLLDRFAARLAISTEPVRARLLRLLEQSAASGVTCLRVCGIGTLDGVADLDLMRTVMSGAPRLRLRGTLDAALLDEWNDLRSRPGFGDDVFRVDTVSAWLHEPPSDALRAARQAGWRTVLHATDDAQMKTALMFFAEHDSDRRDGIECRAMPSPDLLARTKVSLGITGGAVWTDMPADMPISLGRDTAFGASPPLDMLRHAVAGGLPVMRALAAITIDAAKRCGADAILGSLERGKYADFVLLNADPRTTDPATLRCTATWLNGLDVFRA